MTLGETEQECTASLVANTPLELAVTTLNLGLQHLAEMVLFSRTEKIFLHSQLDLFSKLKVLLNKSKL